MEIVFSNNKVEIQCTSVKAAKKIFGGNNELTISLMSRIEALRAADNIKDIIAHKNFRFHSLYDKGQNKYDGYFAIDVKTVREQWRIILRPLDKDGKPYDPCNIDEIASQVRTIEVMEVSKHYG